MEAYKGPRKVKEKKTVLEDIYYPILRLPLKATVIMAVLT